MILHRADTRGYFDHGWLKTYHSFSFAEYYDPSRMHFGKLRVLNDDIVKGGYGFGMHPHNNMEIISIPLQGALLHSDSNGTEDMIDHSKVQVMSAGKGLSHAEKNAFPDKDTNFLQIWIYPKSMNIEPRYDSRSFDPLQRINRFQLLVSPDGTEKSLAVHQKAYLSRIFLDKNKSAEYSLYDKQHGVYVFMIKGEVAVDEKVLKTRDGTGISDQTGIIFNALEDSDLLLIEVPMK
jgi:quercetin 2,3-dioxygenase